MAFLLCSKIVAPALGLNYKVVKESSTATTEAGDKDSSEKQQEAKDDANSEKITCEIPRYDHSLIVTLVNMPGAYLADCYKPSHHFAIISPPPDLNSVLNS